MVLRLVFYRAPHGHKILNYVIIERWGVFMLVIVCV
jgi:hypothetical protein